CNRRGIGLRRHVGLRPEGGAGPLRVGGAADADVRVIAGALLVLAGQTDFAAVIGDDGEVHIGLPRPDLRALQDRVLPGTGAPATRSEVREERAGDRLTLRIVGQGSAVRYEADGDQLRMDPSATGDVIKNFTCFELLDNQARPR